MENQVEEKKERSTGNKEAVVTKSFNRPELAQLTDRFGNTFYFGYAGDLWFPPFPIGSDLDYHTRLRNIRNMEIRPDDVLICSYPKTGLHWASEVINMLKTKATEYSDEATTSGFLDRMPINVINNLGSPRLLVTHVPFRHLPKQVFEKRIKIVLLDRNPKDTLVSYYNHWHVRKPPANYPGTFEQFFHIYFEFGYAYGHHFDYMMEYQEGIEAHPQLDVFVNVYEDMKLDPVMGVKKLNEFLGTGCSQQLCQDIAEACTFQSMKEYKDTHMPTELLRTFKDNDGSFYRKGDVGDWKNWFTVAMNEKFDKEYKNRMKDYKIQHKFTLP